LEFLGGSREWVDAPHLCGQNAVQIAGNQKGLRINLESLAQRLASHGTVSGSELFVRLRCEQIPGGWQDQPVLTVFSDGRAIVKGTSDPAQARTLYARLIGT
jgi:adenylyltransferase/sulfurtransferase